MDVGVIVDYIVQLASKVPAILAVLSVAGSAITVVRAKVKATESNEDDTALANLEAKPLVGLVFKVLEKFSLLVVK